MKYDYWVWNNIFNKKEIISINKVIENEYCLEEPINNLATTDEGEVKKSCKVLLCKYGKIKKLVQTAVEEAVEINTFNFGYSLFPLTNTSYCNFNIYSSRGLQQYHWHVDESPTYVHDIKLTLLINLSLKKYDGGEFSMFKTNQFSIPKFNKPGDMLMFKSYINHKVSPILSGERRTLTLFFHGPRFT